MAEQTQPPLQTLSSRALARLQKIADGNGLDPKSLAVFETQEQIVALKGIMEVSPLCETENVSYPGSVRGKDRRSVESFAALQEAILKHRQEFRENPDWVAATVKELKSSQNQGWGLHSAKVTLPEKSAVYAATEVCPRCRGQKMLVCEQCLGKGFVVCAQCQGQGRELCYNCQGRGEDPHQPGQACPICNGTRLAPCRFCQMQGHVACPACNGNRGTPCPSCQASGAMTQEVKVICGAETHFTLSHENLPSGLRRGLDRIGIENLGKGHADIVSSDPPKENKEDPTPKEKIPVLLYTATLPYAEMKMDFGGKKALVSAVGKRCALSGVPNFLDLSLKPWRDKLHSAALGQAPLENALGARAMKDILSLTATGKESERDVRKLYPFGLSQEAIGAILGDMRLALKKTTLKTRAIAASLCGGFCIAFFYFFFMKGIEAQATSGLDYRAAFGLDLAALAGALGASWGILNFSTRLALKSRFPQMPFALKQMIGKTGLGMAAEIIAAFILFLLLAPAKPLWLARIFVG